MEDEKTKNDLACADLLKIYRIKTTISALGEKEKKSPETEKVKLKNPNRTLFSQESLREHHVPGYDELEEEKSRQEVEEIEL